MRLAKISNALGPSKKAYVKADEIPKILAFFEDRHGEPPEVGSETKSRAASRGAIAEPQNLPPLSSSTRRSRPGPKPRDKLSEPIAVFGPLHPRGGGIYDLESNVTEYCARPPQLYGVAGAFALVIPDDALEPRFCVDEIIYVHPQKTPIVGSWVVVRRGQHAEQVVVGRLSRVDARNVEIQTFYRGRPQSFKRDEVAQIGRIVASATEW